MVERMINDRNSPVTSCVQVAAAFLVTSVAIVLCNSKWPAPLHRGNETSEAGVPIVDSKHPCGLVAVALAARLLGRSAPLVAIERHLYADPNGQTTIGQLCEALEALDIAAAPIHVSLLQLCSPRQLAILHLKDDHFVVVLSPESGNAVVLDPPRMPELLAETDVAQRYSGAAILVADGVESLKSKLSRLGVHAAF